jgi:hypothetical protein
MTAVAIPTMSLIPKLGEVMLYISLHEVENLTPVEVLDLARSLGFKPELRTRTWQQEGETQVGLYAMLYQEQRDPSSGLDPAFLDAELEALHQQISPDVAVRFSYRLQQGRRDAA